MSGEAIKTDIKITRELETPKLDISPYVNVKTKIYRMETAVKMIERKGEHVKSHFVTIYTEKLGETPDGDEITASKQFGLKEDKDTGEVGWSNIGNLAKFLKSKKVEHPNDLIGIEVITKRSEPDNNGQEWLTF